MKTALILSTLLILAYSDNSNYPSNMPKEFYEQMEMQEKCSEAEEEEEKCLAITLSNSNYRCCMLTIDYPINNKDNKDEKTCFIMYKDIKALQEVYNNKIFKAQMKEIFGFLQYGLYFIEEDGKKYYLADSNTFKMKQIYKCSDGTAELSFGYDTYSSEDKSLYDSDDHCLKYFYWYLYAENYDENLELVSVSKDDCLNAKLTQGAIEAGITCGFFQFNINFITGGSKTYQTCYIYNSNFISEGKFDEKTQSELQSFVAQIGSREGDGMYSSYTTQFSDGSGNTYTFDMTGAITQPSSGDVLKMTKYLYLLLIILFMF